MPTRFETVLPVASRRLNDPGEEAVFVHGSLVLGDYIFGTSRGFLTAFGRRSQLVKLHRSASYGSGDYASTFLPAGTYPSAGQGSSAYCYNLDTLCYAGGKLWVAGSDDTSGNLEVRLFEVDPDTLQATSRGTWSGVGVETLLSDGTFLYFTFGTTVIKYEIASRQEVAAAEYKFSDPYAAANNLGNVQNCHAGVLDGGFLYLAASNAANQGTPAYLLKLRASDLAVVGHARIPAVTDDMTQSAEFCFVGVEEASSTAYGYEWGAAAIRKSDMQVFPLPKLGASDTAATRSYASLVFGSYLVEVKTNRHVYVLDVSNPAGWSLTADLGEVLLLDATIQLPAGVNGTPNELVVDPEGFVHSFVWNTASGESFVSSAIKYELPGISLRVTPQVNTLAALLYPATGRAVLRGELVGTGGDLVTERGFYFDVAAPPATMLPVAGVEQGVFALERAGLAPGGVYFVQAYAVNAQGVGRGAALSFTFGEEAGVLFGVVRRGDPLGPVAGARVWLLDTVAEAVRSVVTGADGVYRFTGLPAGAERYHLLVEFADGAEKCHAYSKPFQTAF